MLFRSSPLQRLLCPYISPCLPSKTARCPGQEPWEPSATAPSTHTRTRTRCREARTHTHAHTLAHTHSHARTHAHTHTHAHAAGKQGLSEGLSAALSTMLHGRSHHNAPEFLSSQCSMTVSSQCSMALVIAMLQNSCHPHVPRPCYHNSQSPL